SSSMGKMLSTIVTGVLSEEFAVASRSEHPASIANVIIDPSAPSRRLAREFAPEIDLLFIKSIFISLSFVPDTVRRPTSRMEAGRLSQDRSCLVVRVVG